MSCLQDGIWIIFKSGKENVHKQKPNHYRQQIIITNSGNPMKSEKNSGTPAKKAPAGRGEGLSPSERSILQKSTERHDKALRILSKL
jgi:hypothetical protein